TEKTGGNTCFVVFVRQQNAGHVGIEYDAFEGIAVTLHTDLCIHQLGEVQVEIDVLGFNVNAVSTKSTTTITSHCIRAVTPIAVIELKFGYQLYNFTRFGGVAKTCTLNKIVLSRRVLLQTGSV